MASGNPEKDVPQPGGLNETNVNPDSNRLKSGLAFLSPPVLTERRENAVAKLPTAMGIRQAFTPPPSASYGSIFPTTCQDNRFAVAGRQHLTQTEENLEKGFWGDSGTVSFFLEADALVQIGIFA